MKKFVIYFTLLCLLASLPVLPAAAEENDRSVTEGCHTLDAQAPVLGTQQLIANAESVLLYEVTSDTLMYAWNADAQLYPASFVKLMTALVALEEGSLSDVVTVRADVLATLPDDTTSVQLQENEVLTLEQLLYCMLVSSANDAAAVVADHIAGSQEAFAEKMNQYARQLGCTGTCFTDAHGLSSDGQVTTARDMARILVRALQNEDFRKIFATVDYTVDETNKSGDRYLSSGNYLMNAKVVEIYYDERVTGSRTGIASGGARCVASVAQSGDMELVSIVMGAKSEYVQGGKKIKSFGGFPETSELLDLGFADFKVAQILYSGQAVRQQAVSGGTSDVTMCPKISVSTVLPADCTTEQLDFRYTDTEALQLPIEKDALLSRLEIWHGGLCLAQADLYAMNQVAAVQQTQVSVQEPADNGQWKTALGILAACAAAVLLVIGTVRLVAVLRHAAAGRRSRRYRRDRRRSR